MGTHRRRIQQTDTVAEFDSSGGRYAITSHAFGSALQRSGGLASQADLGQIRLVCWDFSNGVAPRSPVPSAFLGETVAPGVLVCVWNLGCTVNIHIADNVDHAICVSENEQSFR